MDSDRTGLRTSLTIYLGIVALILGCASGIQFDSWRWPFYGLLVLLLAWCSLFVVRPVEPERTTCKFCGREES